MILTGLAYIMQQVSSFRSNAHFRLIEPFSQNRTVVMAFQTMGMRK